MLEPYTVLDFTDERGELGPMLLADLGADVIRVEPADGTAARRCQPLAPGSGQSLQFLAFNRNKRSIVVGSEEREVLQALIRRAHFLFESWPNGLLGAYGLDFEAVKAINPRIVHVCVSPFGREGVVERPERRLGESKILHGGNRCWRVLTRRVLIYDWSSGFWSCDACHNCM